MGWSDQNIIAQIIVIEGSGDGLFIYNGTAELGNPPILAAVAPGVTEDPFGNTVKAVLNIGNFSASHIGWDADGNQYLSGPDGNTRIFMANGSIPTGPNNNMDPAIWFFNDFGAAVLVVDPSAGGTFQYEDLGSATQGGLIGAQQGKTSSVNDPVNNQTVPPGILLIDPVFGDQVQIVGGNINWSLPAFSKDANDTINQGSGSTSPYRHIAAPEQGQAGHIVQRWYGTSVNGTVPPGSVISSTDPPVRSTSEMFEIQGSAVLTIVKAFAPGSTTTEEAWHGLALAANWSNVASEPVYSYRLLPDGNVQITGSATHSTSITGVTQLGNAAVPAAYRPTTTQYIAAGQTGQCGLQITTAGIVNAVPPASGSSTARCNGTYPLNL